MCSIRHCGYSPGFDMDHNASNHAPAHKIHTSAHRSVFMPNKALVRFEKA